MGNVATVIVGPRWQWSLRARKLSSRNPAQWKIGRLVLLRQRERESFSPTLVRTHDEIFFLFFVHVFSIFRLQKTIVKRADGRSEGRKLFLSEANEMNPMRSKSQMRASERPTRHDATKKGKKRRRLFVCLPTSFVRFVCFR